MKIMMFTVYDSAAKAYIQPFFAPTTALARRMFGQAANDESHHFNQFAKDYTLFQTGEFDQETARYIECTAPIPLGTALTYIETKPLTVVTTDLEETA